MHHVVQLWFFLLPRHHERWVYIKDPYLCCHKPYCTIGNRWNDSRGAVDKISAVNNGTPQYHGTFYFPQPAIKFAQCKYGSFNNSLVKRLSLPPPESHRKLVTPSIYSVSFAMKICLCHFPCVKDIIERDLKVNLSLVSWKASSVPESKGTSFLVCSRILVAVSLV